MSGPVRSLPGLALALARAWWRELAALAAASAVLATTIGGSLGVGDAIGCGLARLAAARLGRIEAAVVSERPLTPSFVAGLAAEAAAGGGRAVAACVLPVTVAAGGGTAVPATLLAIDDPAALGFEPPPPPFAGGSVLVNERLARDAGIAAGAAVVIRLPRRMGVPADTPLGRRDAESSGRRMAVAAVVPDEGLGGFSLRPVQSTAPLVVMSLADAGAILGRGDAGNVVMLVGVADRADGLAAIRPRPALADLGLTLAAAEAGGPLRLTSDRLVIPPDVDRVAEHVLRPLGGRPSLAFLTTEIVPLDAAGDRVAARVPYSTVLGIETTSLPGGDLVDAAGALLTIPDDDGIVIDRWLADDLTAQDAAVAVGDRLELRFFLPETIHGRVEESGIILRVAGIAEMRGGAVDRSLVPEVEGVTDEDSIADWDPPFPFDASRVRTVPPDDVDDRYWKQYRAAPKAFVSLATARRLAAGRFGRTTAWHLPAAAAGTAAEIGPRLAAEVDPARLGLAVVPLAVEAAVAARGATPFGPLFLALSSFVIAAALGLAWLLFGLLIAARRRELGLLVAVGWPPARLAILLATIGGLAAAVGAVAGLLAGPAWARLLVDVLGGAWNARVEPGSARLFAASRPTWHVLVPGVAAGLGLSIAAVALAARRAATLHPRSLLAGGPPATEGGRRIGGGWSKAVAVPGLGLAVLAAIVGRRADAANAVALFFVAGFAALAGMLAAVRGRLIGGGAPRPVRSLGELAARSAGERPGRAFSIAAIVACGQFLVAAVSAFAVRPPLDPLDRSSPTGGWTTIASFGEPTSIDPADPESRGSLGLSDAEARALAACEIARLRATSGDDASCTNLYAAPRPLVVGVGRDFIDRGGFRFTAHAGPAAGEQGANPWQLLAGRRAPGGPVPAVLDEATARWGLRLGGVGSRFSINDEAGEPAECEIVGLLAPGILQGRVIVAEDEFVRLFPSQSGYRLALVDASRVAASERDPVATGLRAAWADAGVSLEPTSDRLGRLLAVQDTFLGGFQALGTLGLLLGTAGVAAVMLQGVAERRGTLAVLRAIGFTLARVRLLVVLESLWPVAVGLAAGTAAAMLAVWPAIADGGAAVPVRWIAATCGLTLAVAAAAAWLAVTRTTIPERPA